MVKVTFKLSFILKQCFYTKLKLPVDFLLTSHKMQLIWFLIFKRNPVHIQEDMSLPKKLLRKIILL